MWRRAESLLSMAMAAEAANKNATASGPLSKADCFTIPWQPGNSGRLVGKLRMIGKSGGVTTTAPHPISLPLPNSLTIAIAVIEFGSPPPNSCHAARG